MAGLTREALRTAAGPLRDALADSARDLDNARPVAGHNRRLTLLIVAGACFLFGLLWAKSRNRTF